MASFVAGAGVAVAFLALGAGVVAGGRESGVAENPAISIESGFASRASTHKSKTSRKVRQQVASTLSANFRCEQMRSVAVATPVHRLQPQFTDCIMVVAIPQSAGTPIAT